jgi:DNA-binding MurR/RpiR family transcriptional regulator
MGQTASREEPTRQTAKPVPDTPPASNADVPSVRVLALFRGFRLTPTQRRIAQCLVEHASQAAYLSSGEVAELAGVSQPSVIRLAVALGYSGYPALRRQLREVVTGGTAEEAAEARRNELQQAVAAEITNLTNLTAALADPAPIQQAGTLLMDSRPLVVVGLRASAPLASYFGYFAAKVHPDVRVITTGGSLALDKIEQARDFGAAALFAVILPRYPAETLQILDAARALGLRVVALTDTPMSPVTNHADIVLTAGISSELVFDTHASPAVFCMVLLQAMCDADPVRTAARLEAFETSAAQREIFVP